MYSLAQAVPIVVSVLFLIIIFELTRRKKLKEKYALLWIVTGTVILILAVFQDLTIIISGAMGIKTPINALIFIGIFFILMFNLYFSLVVTNLNEKVKKLGQKLSILQQKMPK